MTITTKRNAITLAIVSAIVLTIGIILIPVADRLATVIITLATVCLAFAIYNLRNIIIAERRANGDKRRKTIIILKWRWRDVVRVLTLVGVIIIIIILIKGCDSKTVVEYTGCNSEATSSTTETTDATDVTEETTETTTEIAETTDVAEPVHVCAFDHTDSKSATCTQDGYSNKVCSCGKVIKSTTIKATGHDWNNGKITEEATEESTGTKTYICKNCGKTKAEKIGKLVHECTFGHTDSKPATCTQDGYSNEVCSCGKVIKSTTIKATGHDWNNGKITEEATEESAGTKTYTCKNCGETKAEETDKLEHECRVCEVDEKEATCTKSGYIRKLCSCGNVIKSTTIKATGHDWERFKTVAPTSTKDGYIKYKCSNCSKVRTDVTPATGEFEEPADDKFQIKVNGEDKLNVGVFGDEFDAIEVWTEGSENTLEYYQSSQVFDVEVNGNSIKLTASDEECYGYIIIWDPAHQEKQVEVHRFPTFVAESSPEEYEMVVGDTYIIE